MAEGKSKSDIIFNAVSVIIGVFAFIVVVVVVVDESPAIVRMLLRPCCGGHGRRVVSWRVLPLLPLMLLLMLIPPLAVNALRTML